VLKGFSEAEKEKKPALREMFTDVYEELTDDLKDQMVELKSMLERYPDEYDVSDYDGGKDSLKN
jgi:2-oxoisovalerate dehydrogenase E1 component alpha subunit